MFEMIDVSDEKPVRIETNPYIPLNIVWENNDRSYFEKESLHMDPQN